MSQHIAFLPVPQPNIEYLQANKVYENDFQTAQRLDTFKQFLVDQLEKSYHYLLKSYHNKQTLPYESQSWIYQYIDNQKRYICDLNEKIHQLYKIDLPYSKSEEIPLESICSGWNCCHFSDRDSVSTWL